MSATSGSLISVVITVYDSRKHLPALCERLTSLDEPPGGYEVVFVDNRSTDGSADYLAHVAADDERIRLVDGPGIGPAAGRNRGVAAARGRFVAFTDPDTLPERDWLAAAARALADTGGRALEGAVLPESEEPAGVLVRRVRNEEGGRYMTANMIYERELLDAIGGFDERFRPPPFLEDSDLAFRVLDAGIEIPFAPDVRVRHLDLPATPRQMLASQRTLEWMALVAAKHPARYRTQLRPKVQLFRPGDLPWVATAPAALAARGSRLPMRLAAWMAAAFAMRRVVRASGVAEVSAAGRPGWAAAALAAPFLRVFYAGRGWWRFGRPRL